MERYARQLDLSDSLRTPLIGKAIHFLDLPNGSRGLDVGCGIGSHTLLLAQAVGPGGHVTGLDVSPALLARAREKAGRSSHRGRITFQAGDMYRLPFRGNVFDWVWSVDCAGYGPGEPVPLLRELVRVTRPGGRIALLAWTSQQLLPGHPVLEARLNATRQGIAPFKGGDPPERHILRAKGWFEEAGLTGIGAGTFAGDIRAPLSPRVRDALISLFEMRWGDPKGELDDEDLADYEGLCRSNAPGCILNAADYYAFFTYSLFYGRKAS